MSFLRQLRVFIRIFQRLFGMFESGLVIFFPVVRGGSTVALCAASSWSSAAFSCESIGIVFPILGVRLILSSLHFQDRSIMYTRSLDSLLTPDSRAYRRSGIAPRHGGVCRRLLAPF